MPPAPSASADEGTSRLDRWLWALRLFKTRPLATEACRRGAVEVGGGSAKPARNVHAGEIVTIRLAEITRTLRVIGSPKSRVGAKLVGQFCVDLTPSTEFERMRERSLQRGLIREKGLGRPTKKERRGIDRFFG